MSTAQLKPWFQTEDDGVADERAALGHATSEPIEIEESRRLTDRLADSAFVQRLAEWRISSSWSLIPISLAVVWLMGYRFIAPRGIASIAWQSAGAAVLMMAAALIVVLARLARRCAVRELLQNSAGRLEDAAAALSIIPVEPEFRPIWRAIESHTDNIQRRVNELLADRERMVLELTLAEAQRKRALTVVGVMPDPVLVTNAFDQIIMANPAAEELFHFKFDQRGRRPIEEVVSDERLVSTIRQAREADRRAADRRGEHEIAGRHFASTLLPLEDGTQTEGGESNHGVVVILRDVTREKEISKKKSEFVAHVSHELRTPLSSIRAYVEMLVDGEAADEATRKEYYDIIQTSAERLGRLIDNMLNISRIEAGTVRINREPMPISVVVKEACDMMRPAAEEKKITLVEHLAPVIYRVSADRDLIYQAVLNLISNAVKYTGEGGNVTVRMTPREEERTVLIEVSDTGAGIPSEDLPRMFEKFFRVEANKKMAKGTGLGLNLVKQIVEQIHEGQMSLTSEVGKGSTFGITLPLLPEGQ